MNKPKRKRGRPRKLKIICDELLNQKVIYVIRNHKVNNNPSKNIVIKNKCNKFVKIINDNICEINKNHFNI